VGGVGGRVGTGKGVVEKRVRATHLVGDGDTDVCCREKKRRGRVRRG